MGKESKKKSISVLSYLNESGKKMQGLMWISFFALIAQDHDRLGQHQRKEHERPPGQEQHSGKTGARSMTDPGNTGGITLPCSMAPPARPHLDLAACARGPQQRPQEKIPTSTTRNWFPENNKP
jgi:hypothetical protein